MSVFSGPEVVNSGLFLYLDANNTKSYPGNGTVWYDLSGNSNNGTIVNAPTYDGKTFIFSSASSQRVSIPYQPQWRLAGSNTISCWTNGVSANGCVVGYQKSSWEGYNVSGSNVAYSGTAGSNDIFASITKSADEWCMFTWVIDRTAGFYYLYKNGTFVSSKAITQPDLTATFSAGELTVGGNSTITSRYYTGSISAVAFYTRALSAAEVSQNFEAYRGRFGI